MVDAYYVLRDDNFIPIKNTNGFYKLYWRVFGERNVEPFTNFVMNNTDGILEFISATLTDYQKDMIRAYAEDRDIESAMQDVKAKYNYNDGQFERRREHFYRRLRHPSFSKFLRGRDGIWRYRSEREYYDDIKKQIKNEIGTYIHVFPTKGHVYLPDRIVYLPNIFEKNHIVVKSVGSIQDYAEWEIELLGLSDRAFSILEHEGIQTLMELKNKTEEEIMRIRHLEKKSFEEIMNVLSNFPNDNLKTFEITIDGDKTVYKYSDEKEEDVIQSVYTLIFKNPLKPSILEADYPFGFLNFTLMAGYIYKEDVLNDLDKIEKNAREVGFNAVLNDIKPIRLFAKWPDNEENLVLYVSDKLKEYMDINEVTTFTKLKSLPIDDESLLEIKDEINALIQCLEEALATNR